MDKENLDSIAGALVDALSVLRRQTCTITLRPLCVAADSVTIDRENRKKIRKIVSQNFTSKSQRKVVEARSRK